MGREIKKERNEELNLLRLRQVYLNKKVVGGQNGRMWELKNVHNLINNWYKKEAEKIKYQSLTGKLFYLVF